MSTDPSTPSPGQPPSTSAASPSRAPVSTPGPSPAPVRTGSGAVARLLTLVYALIVTPVAAGLVAYGGVPWQQYLMMRATNIESLLEFLFSPNGFPSLLAMVGGLLLLVSVVATGLASSAGLLSVTALSLFPLSLSVIPQLTISLYEVLPESLRLAGLGLYSQGMPLVLYPVMGGLGLALVIARRRPRPHLGVSLPGLVLVPIMMLIGMWLIMYGYALVMRSFNITFGAEPSPAPAVLALVIGMALLWLSSGAAGASPYALVLPALVLLALSVALVVPGVLMMLPGVVFSQTGSMALSVLIMGAGPGLGLVLLAHTAVQFAVASRARRRAQAASAP